LKTEESRRIICSRAIWFTRKRSELYEQTAVISDVYDCNVELGQGVDPEASWMFYIPPQVGTGYLPSTRPQEDKLFSAVRSVRILSKNQIRSCYFAAEATDLYWQCNVST
jgi:hypothetical protein